MEMAQFGHRSAAALRIGISACLLLGLGASWPDFFSDDGLLSSTLRGVERRVDPQGQVVLAARSVGIEFGG